MSKKPLVFLALLSGLMFGTVAQADMTLKMAAGNPCAMNPCEMKHNPCNPCAKKHMKHNPCNPCAKKHMKHNPCNPCAMKHNPCNPCGMKRNPCNPCNPCAGGAPIDAAKVTRPAGTSLNDSGSRAKLVKKGEKLFNDPRLSTNGLSCNDCHATHDLFNASFTKPYPHKVSMAKQRSGVDMVDADEFVQFCLMAPMESKPLPWNSKKLAALTAYVTDVKQPEFIQFAKANPCALKKTGMNPCNPCAMKGNPCNPCAMKHMKGNPCNPCAMKHKKHNPCNPCAMKGMKHNPCAMKRHNPCAM